MGAPLTRLFLEALFKAGLQDIHDKPSIVDMLFSKFSYPILQRQYGYKEIESVKNHIINNKISVLQAFPLTAEKVPSFSIQVIATDEDASKAFFDDKAEDEEVQAPVVTLLSFTPSAYDSPTGFITCPTGTDLTNIYIGAIFVDAAGSQFEITGPILTDKFAISPSSDVTLGECSIIDMPNWDIAPVHETPLVERIQIGVHAGENTNSCEYLTYIAMWILQSKRLQLENIGIQLHSFSVSEFVRNLEFLPDNVINRFINFNAKTWFRWKDDPLQSLTNKNAIVGVKVDKDVWIKTGDFTVLTTDGTED